MRRGLFCVLMMTLLLSAGCGQREAELNEGLESFRQTVSGAQSVRASVELRAVWDDGEQRYGLTLDGEPTRPCITVTSPELLAGIAATVSDDGAQIEFEGVILALPPVSGDGLTPVSAVPAILRAVRRGYLELAWWDDGYIAARLTTKETAVATVWIDPDTLALKWAELSDNGKTVVSCEFSNWEIT